MITTPVDQEVACGAASRLRLKRLIDMIFGSQRVRRMWSGFSSEIETRLTLSRVTVTRRRMWSGFSSEIETYEDELRLSASIPSHVERLLV